MTEDFQKNCGPENPFHGGCLEREDDVYMVEPQEALWKERFCSGGVCLIADPVWRTAPQIKLYRIDGMDRRGNRTEIFVAGNRGGTPGFVKAQLDKTLASPYLLLTSRPRIIQSGQIITRCDSAASAVAAYLPQGFLPIVTSRLQKLRQMLASLKKRLDRLQDREIDEEIIRMEFAVVPDWTSRSMVDTSESMFFPLTAKLLRIGYGTRYLPGGAAVVANIGDDPLFFTQIAEFARFAGAPILLLKRKDRDGMEKLELAGGESHVIQNSSFRNYMIQCVNHRNGRICLHDSKSPGALRQAVAGTLGLELFRRKNIFGKMSVDLNAKRFDEHYAEYKQKERKRG